MNPYTTFFTILGLISSLVRFPIYDPTSMVTILIANAVQTDTVIKPAATFVETDTTPKNTKYAEIVAKY